MGKSDIEFVPEEQDQGLAQNALHVLRDLQPNQGKVVCHDIEMSANVLEVLKAMLEKIAGGDPFSIVSIDRDFTTSEAARILRFSTGHLYKLLDSGEIPFRKVGSHRRIDARDLFRYKEKLEMERRQTFKEISRLGQELDE